MSEHQELFAELAAVLGTPELNDEWIKVHGQTEAHRIAKTLDQGTVRNPVLRHISRLHDNGAATNAAPYCQECSHGMNGLGQRVFVAYPCETSKLILEYVERDKDIRRGAL